MQVIGKGYVHIYPPVDECPHDPGPEEQWQESFVLFAWDMERDVHLFFRIGQEPNRGSGFTAVWLNVWTPDHVFHHTDISVPMQAGDRTQKSLTSGNGLCRYEFDGQHRWSIKAPDVEVNVAMQDAHPGFGYWPDGAGALVSDTAKCHIEANGIATGTVTLKGKTYQIKGTAWRDHSWGKRNWNGILTHRGAIAMFGDFNFFSINFVGADGKKVKFGSIVRGDTIQAASDFKIVAHIDEDGISNLGGTVRLNHDGQAMDMTFTPLAKGSISPHQNFMCVDTMCRVTCGSRVGVGFIETSHNAMAGSMRPHIFADCNGIIDNGIFPRRT